MPRKPAEDLSGRVFHRWTVLGFSHIKGKGQRFWNARCQCGTEKTVNGHALRGGYSKSCGCLQRELQSSMMSHKNTKGTLAEGGIKKCCSCEIEKPVNEFSAKTSTKDHLNPLCRRCVRHRHLINDYGITADEYDLLLVAQGHRCGCCRNALTENNRSSRCAFWPVDHCHKTGNMRSILCAPCNFIVGFMETHNIAPGKLTSYIMKASQIEIFARRGKKAA